ncbi:neuronal pentraxin-1-like [Ptychodera flava]|uniref:neuronal pentraxin-1-like n=1 Tax=Ptychodera flava TaxID=63121 RepID=UPI00396A050B
MVGSLTEFNLWSRSLTADEIAATAGDCSIGGDVFSWNIGDLFIEGDVLLKIEDVCLSHISNRTIVVLRSPNTNVIVSELIPEMSSLTACIWAKIVEVGHNAALVSYAASEHDNEFLIHYLGEGFHVYISNALLIIKAPPIDDGAWHHVCFTWSSGDGHWQYYHNGVLTKSGRGFQSGNGVKSSGYLVLGQEQDTVGGGYDTNQALVGSLTHFNMWSRVLPADVISELERNCSLVGDVFAWNIGDLYMEGDVSMEIGDIC